LKEDTFALTVSDGEGSGEEPINPCDPDGVVDVSKVEVDEGREDEVFGLFGDGEWEFLKRETLIGKVRVKLWDN
jgi:hypothetical protein